MEDNSTFKYEYSAEKAKQVEEIVNKYVPKEKDKVTQLKELDAAVERKATMKSITVGIVGVLILGAGMSIIMEAASAFFVVGIVVGLIGMAVMGMAFPIHKKTLKKEREAVAAQVLALSQEITKEV